MRFVEPARRIPGVVGEELAIQPASQACFAAAKAICRRHAKSFYFASHFLPKEKRNASFAVYAFCRLLDDAVDTRPGREEEGIIEFESTLARVYADDVSDFSQDEPGLALRAFHAIIRKYDIPQKLFNDLAYGCRMDLSITQYATWQDLEVYCYHVAGVVGLIMSCIFGPIDEPAKQQAVSMGNAMQLTNILRDVKEDFDRGRIYLPQEDLDRHGVDLTALSNGAPTQEFVDLMQFQITRARNLYRCGAQGLCHLADDGSRLTASAMAVIYCGILKAIEAQQYDVFSQRAHLSFWQKIARIPAARKLARRKVGQPLPEVFC